MTLKSAVSRLTAALHVKRRPVEQPNFRASLARAMALTNPSYVEAGMTRLEPFIAGNDRLISETHPQLAPGAIGTDYEYANEQVDDANAMAAAACLAHASDAWEYFASATRAALSGDLSIAKHLLYYSELRSAFSILARQGVLIRNSNHVVVTGLASVENLGPRPTHDAVWEALKEWMRTSTAKSFFLDRLKIDRISLREWLDGENEAELTQVPMDEILRMIGYDLSNFKKDRVRRNLASYSARQLQSHVPRHVDGWFAQKLSEYWSVSEPLVTNGFEALDTHFCLRVIIRIRERAKKPTNPVKLHDHFEAMSKKFGLDQPETIAETAKRHKETPGGRIIADAMITTESPSPSEEIVSMFARALLLARFATLAVEDLIDKSGASIATFDNWTANLGAQHGLWDQDAEVTLFDVWSGSKNSADDLTHHMSSKNLYAFMSNASKDTFSATSFAALALWWRGSWSDDLPGVA